MNADLSRRIGRHIDRGESELLAGLLLGLSEPERAALVPMLKAEVRALGWDAHRKIGPLRVAGAACLPTAAQVAAWLGRSALRWPGLRVDLLIETLLQRGVSWLPDLAARVAAKLPARPDDAQWTLAAELVKVSGGPVPTNDGFVRGWVEACIRLDPAPRERLRADPFLEVLLPRLFEVDDLGALLHVGSWRRDLPGYDPTAEGTAALASLAVEGRISRGFLLDGTVGRLLRSDTRTALRAFVQLHGDIDPSPDEIYDRRADYLRLLLAEYAPVAAMAQRALRRLDAAGRLDLDSLLEVVRDVLTRPDKALVRAQLAWLDAVARREKARTGQIVVGAAAALANPHLDISDRALALIDRHAADLSDLDRTHIASLAQSLAPDIRDRTLRAIGVEPDSAASAGPSGMLGPLPGGPASAGLPTPIASVAELVSELVVILDSGVEDPVGWERVLDALARLAAQQPHDLREAVRPIVARPDDSPASSIADWSPDLHLRRILRVIALEPSDRSRARSRPRSVDPPQAAPGSGPLRVLVARLEEFSLTVGTPRAPRLLATPTSTSGHVDVATLVGRIAEMEHGGSEPGPIDLGLALLRLPREIDPDAAKAAGALTSSAGRRLRGFLDGGGLADPATTVHLHRQHRATDAFSWDPKRVVQRRLVSVAAAPPSADMVTHAVLGARPGTARQGVDWFRGLWPSVLPSHREVVAAYLLPRIADAAEFDTRGGAMALPQLVEATGPLGPATALCIAYGLAARHAEDRTATVDAVLHLAAARDLPAPDVGAHVGALCAAGNIKLSRVVIALNEIARAGAPAAVWDMIATALPDLLATTRPGPGLPDLLQLAAQVADSGRPPSVAARARLRPLAQRGSGRLATEANRLIRSLAPGS